VRRSREWAARRRYYCIYGVELFASVSRYFVPWTLCLRNVPRLTCYNLDTDYSIMIVFGTNVTEKVGNQNVLYFPTSPN